MQVRASSAPGLHYHPIDPQVAGNHLSRPRGDWVDQSQPLAMAAIRGHRELDIEEAPTEATIKGGTARDHPTAIGAHNLPLESERTAQ